MWNWGGSGCEYQTSDWCWTEQEGITQSRPEIKRERLTLTQAVFQCVEVGSANESRLWYRQSDVLKWFHPTNKSKRSWQNWKKDIPGVRVPPVYWAAFTCCASCWWSRCFQCSQTAHRYPGWIFDTSVLRQHRLFVGFELAFILIVTIIVGQLLLQIY